MLFQVTTQLFSIHSHWPINSAVYMCVWGSRHTHPFWTLSQLLIVGVFLNLSTVSQHYLFVFASSVSISLMGPELVWSKSLVSLGPLFILLFHSQGINSNSILKPSVPTSNCVIFQTGFLLRPEVSGGISHSPLSANFKSLSGSDLTFPEMWS